MPFATAAKALKDKSKITLKQVAAEVGVSESMMSRYLNGVNIPPQDVAEKILDVLARAAAEAKINPDDSAENTQMAIAALRQIYENHLADLKSRLAQERTEKWILGGILAFVIALVFIVLAIDLLNGNIGWFRH